jgi:general secretion pathway protein C
LVVVRDGGADGSRPGLAYARRGAEVVLVALLAVQAARLVWAMAAPLGPLGQPAGAATAGVRGDTAVLSRFDPFHRAVVSGAPAVADTSGLRLYGVRMGAGASSAIIAGADGQQRSYRVGEAVTGGATLQAVASDHVELLVGGRVTSLAFPKPGGGGEPPPAAGTVVTPSGAAPEASRLAQIAAQVPVQPRIENGRVTGLAVSGPGGPLAAAGLQPGDILVSINGKPLLGAENVGAELATTNQAVVEYERGGERRTATVNMGRP